MKNEEIECSNVAEKLAEALASAGIVSDEPEAAHNPYWAAQQAFFLCTGLNGRQAWNDFREHLPVVAYYGKLAEYCHRALRRIEMSDELREPVCFAWGYFVLLTEVCREAERDIGSRKMR